ncbi:hypothetical protein PHYSODRAFT_321237 [Phytophthora sojae]|uniref:Uncharacterized protein n=1 Tax=Phytophthora sojae (strain P6497) TaxID=1094619 RepID=G4YGU5_PHYSP|nr:hypothetical protein PHYSODRAFT_321237 [Phytophthora sojae]EGZ27426.1 hypothetical protein PHYSODRAFT_321237 [Phytophthora sojae]|eukprot:XP_009514701.1 hypothetical protein PHYSODRAFT_321237 [Phytophthora sojae]
MVSSTGPSIATNCRIPLSGQLADSVPSRPFSSGFPHHVRPSDEGRPDASEAPYEADAPAPRTRVAVTIADPFVNFVQRKYDASQARLEDANLRAANPIAAVDRMKDDLRQFETLGIQYDRFR